MHRIGAPKICFAERREAKALKYRRAEDHETETKARERGLQEDDSREHVVRSVHDVVQQRFVRELQQKVVHNRDLHLFCLLDWSVFLCVESGDWSSYRIESLGLSSHTSIEVAYDTILVEILNI
jgi:hypothetical protein